MDFFGTAAGLDGDEKQALAMELLLELKGEPGSPSPKGTGTNETAEETQSSERSGDSTKDSLLAALSSALSRLETRPAQGGGRYMTLRSMPYEPGESAKPEGGGAFLSSAYPAEGSAAAGSGASAPGMGTDPESVSRAVERESRRVDGPFERY